MQVVKAIAHFETILVDAIDKDSTTMVLDSISTPAGNLPAGTYGFVIEQESNSKREYVIGTLSGSTLTFTFRDVSPLDAETASSSGDDQRKSHRKGASIKLSNFPILTQLARILSGDAELDADTPIVLDASRTPVSANELVTKEYVDSVVNGGSVYFETQILRGDAGETIAAGELVYLKETDGEWYKVNTANTDWYNKQLGIAKGSGTDGNAIGGGGVLISGLDNSISYTAGQLYYGTDTAGTIGTSAGTYELKIGIGDANNKLVFFGNAYRLTDAEKDAIAGSLGTPSGSNKFITEQNTSAGDTDQAQSTQNANTAVGEADATTKRNQIAQSFIPTKLKMRGVKLYKDADTGTFTGNVKIALQADSSGSPSGSDLASITIPNAVWLGMPTGEFEAAFATEYASIILGNTYWIVITPSTSDNSNHPNLGTNSAGGYGSGSVKYKNTTDGWTAISTIDLYFKTIEGVVEQKLKTSSTANIPMVVRGGLLGKTLSSQSITDGSSAGEVTLFQKRIPAKSLGTGNIISGVLFLSNFGIKGGGGETFTLKLKYGGTTIATATITVDGGTSIDVPNTKGKITFELVANAATNAQIGAIQMFTAENDAEADADAAVSMFKAHCAASGTGAEDSTGDLNLTITGQYGSANAANDLTVLYGFLQLIKE